MNDPTAENNSHSARAGRRWIAAAAVLWSTSGLFAKLRLFDVWPATSRGPLMAFWRSTLAALALAGAVRRPRWSAKLVPLVALFATMNVSYLTALTLTTAANAIWLQSTAPWWVFLISAVVLRQPLPRAERMPLVFGAAGLALILYFEMQGAARTGVVCGLVAGVSYAGVVLLMRALCDEDSAWLVTICHLVTALVLLPYVIWLAIWPDRWQFAALAALGVLQMALPYLFLIRGLRQISAQEAVAIGLIEPLLLPLWAYLVRGEVPAWWTAAGGALILAGLALRYAISASHPTADVVE